MDPYGVDRHRSAVSIVTGVHDVLVVDAQCEPSCSRIRVIRFADLLVAVVERAIADQIQPVTIASYACGARTRRTSSSAATATATSTARIAQTSRRPDGLPRSDCVTGSVTTRNTMATMASPVATRRSDGSASALNSDSRSEGSSRTPNAVTACGPARRSRTSAPPTSSR